MKLLTPSNIAIGAVYFVLIGGVIGGFFYARRWAVDTYTSEAEFEAWERWRGEAERQSNGEGPVQRRVPKANAPPALILTQDYFAQFLTIAIVLTTAIYATFVFLIRGVMRSPGVVLTEDRPFA